MTKFISDLLNSDAFRLTLALGTVATVVLGITAGALRRTRPIPVGGAVFAAVVVVVAWQELALPPGVALGAVAMIGGALLGRELWEWVLGAAVGAFMVVRGGTDFGGALMIASIVVLALLAGLVVDFDRTHRDSAMGLPMLAVAIVGVLITVPDTQRAFGLFGAVIPLALLGWPLRLVSLGSGAAGAVALIAWVAFSAGTARPGAAVGALASLGLMIAEPVGRHAWGRTRSALESFATAGRMWSLLVIAVHGGLVLGASRIAGLREEAGVALAIAAAVLVPGVVLGAARVPPAVPDTAPEPQRQPPS